MLRRVVAVGGAGGVAALLLVAGAPAATAAPFDAGSASSTGSGYAVTATVTFTGDAAPAGGGTVRRSVPATCWWERPADAPADDPAAMVAWFRERQRELAGTSFAFGSVIYSTAEEWEAAVAAETAGRDLTWYRANCVDTDQGRLADFTGRRVDGGPSLGLAAVSWAAFPAGAVPEPEIDPEVLAELARDEMEIPVPEVDRNPRSTGLDATFVGLPTRFWVTDEDAVGGATGTRTIRADVGGTWAEVTATTGGLTVSSEAGGVTCDPEEARTPWAAGEAEGAGCSVAFERASVRHASGFPVDLSTTWTATWTASEGPGGTLAPLARDATTSVPVAEAQSLVRPGR